MLAGAIIFSNLTAGPVTAEAAGGTAKCHSWQL